MYRKCNVVYLGCCDYQEAYSYQRQLICKRMGYKIPDTLVLLYHPPILTIGRKGARGHILVEPEVLRREGILVYETDRSGDITYHGPGQLLAYPILDLKQHVKDERWLVNNYEEVVIRLLKDYSLSGYRRDKCPGVWVGNRKISTLGIAISNWISYHGFALNINTNLNHFSYIDPCGKSDQGVTSLEKERGAPVDEEEVRERVIWHFGQVFNLEMLNYLDK
ncbi:octanoate-protein-N-octanoyltransferase [Desulfocucumis palustris]|uniref:Octanoyltransferase n=1 Tax=Desulfocucumis palustris TaxID=1898651 RepID=A0A2L2X8I3_9FIRM|nr:lipoyl(octanoyl) transferase LipB [Desulfocucumis palustris]GBF32234.1 octanoate-protein-N-octanoyltransferase [Desulfocucumis palustris]